MAVVFDEQRVEAVGGETEAHEAGGGAGVANDVGDGFADGEREYGLFGGAELERGWLERGVEVEGDAGGAEGAASEVELGGEAFGAVADDGAADLGEGFAGGGFDVGDLGSGGACVGRVRSLLEEAAGELGFEDDDGEGVAEDVVHVARDAFALGEGGEALDLVLGAEEAGAGAFFLAR